MKKNGVTIFFISFAMIFMTSPAFNETWKTSTSLDNPIKIGGSLPLTGIFSEVGKWVKAGYDYWGGGRQQEGRAFGASCKSDRL